MEIERSALIARVKWLPEYRERVVSGQHGTYDAELHESLNFHEEDGRLYGYFRVKGRAGDPRLKLKRLGAAPKSDSAENVLVIFIATDPDGGGQRPVGWYRHATVLPEQTLSPADARLRHGRGLFHVVEAEARFGVELDETERREAPIVPHQVKGSIGTADHAYVEDLRDSPKPLRKLIRWVLATAREREFISTPEQAAAGLQHDPVLRAIVGAYAERRVLKELKGWKAEPHPSASDPYDLTFIDHGKKHFVEVKGTVLSNSKTAVLISGPELEHARAHADRWHLCVVTAIDVTGYVPGDKTFKPKGGTLHFFELKQVEPRTQPTEYRVELPTQLAGLELPGLLSGPF